MQTLQTISAFLTLVITIIGSIVVLIKYLDIPINIFRKNQARKESELLKKITDNVKNEYKPVIDEIRGLNEDQDRKMDLLICSSRDLLRARIVEIIDKYKPYKKITERDREVLDQLYNDYKNEDGNGTVERAYKRTEDWEVISEDTSFLN